MIVYILCSSGKPFRVYDDEKEAYDEYRRLRDLDDYVDYSVINMAVKESKQRENKRWEPKDFRQGPSDKKEI